MQPSIGFLVVLETLGTESEQLGHAHQARDSLALVDLEAITGAPS